VSLHKISFERTINLVAGQWKKGYLKEIRFSAGKTLQNHGDGELHLLPLWNIDN